MDGCKHCVLQHLKIPNSKSIRSISAHIFQGPVFRIRTKEYFMALYGVLIKKQQVENGFCSSLGDSNRKYWHLRITPAETVNTWITQQRWIPFSDVISISSPEIKCHHLNSKHWTDVMSFYVHGDSQSAWDRFLTYKTELINLISALWDRASWHMFKCVRGWWVYVVCFQ